MEKYGLRVITCFVQAQIRLQIVLYANGVVTVVIIRIHGLDATAIVQHATTKLCLQLHQV